MKKNGFKKLLTGILTIALTGSLTLQSGFIVFAAEDSSISDTSQGVPTDLTSTSDETVQNSEEEEEKGEETALESSDDQEKQQEEEVSGDDPSTSENTGEEEAVPAETPAEIIVLSDEDDTLSQESGEESDTGESSSSSDSDNTPIEVIFNLTTSDDSTGHTITDTITETITLNISGTDADFKGGYIDVVLDNEYLNVSPSKVNGVTATVTSGEGKTTIHYELNAGLVGGSYYSLVFTYAFKGGYEYRNAAASLPEKDYTVTTTAEFCNEDGTINKYTKPQEQKHSFLHYENAVRSGTSMSRDQVVGYDTDGDGVIDRDTAGKLSFYVYTGFTPGNDSFIMDIYAAGTGIFLGRGTRNSTGSHYGVVAPVSEYTYDIPLIEGLTLSEESRNLGWEEDENGYHLTATEDHNPIGGDEHTTSYSNSHYVPIIFDIKDGAASDTITGNTKFTVNASYKEAYSGKVYEHSSTTDYSVTILESSAGSSVISVSRDIYKPDSDIVKPYGQAYYRTTYRLNHTVAAETPIDMSQYSVVIHTNNENEYLYAISIQSIIDKGIFSSGGKLYVYNEKTNELITTIDSTNTGSLKYIDYNKVVSISRDLQIQSVRLKFEGFTLSKTSSSGGSDSNFYTREYTFFAKPSGSWTDLYEDSSITKLTSSTTVTVYNKNNEEEYAPQTRTTDLVRVKQYVSAFNTPREANFTSRTQTVNGSLGEQRFTINTRQNVFYTEVEQLFGPFESAYLIDPNLKLVGTDGTEFNVIYNYNDTGKDLYTWSGGSVDYITIANEFIPNGRYTAKCYKYWNPVAPNMVIHSSDNLGEVNGYNVTSENSIVHCFAINLNASERSGVLTRVKRSEGSEYSYNISEMTASENVDFQITYSNADTKSISNVKVITSLPRIGDSLLDSDTSRKSEFAVYLTQAVTPPSGWIAEYTTAVGDADELENSKWAGAGDISDWTAVTAIRFKSTGIIEADSDTNFVIANALISGDALEGQTAYLSSAASVAGYNYAESNKVSINMKKEISDGRVIIHYVNEDLVPIHDDVILTEDINRPYDVSDQKKYYPKRLVGKDGLPYQYVETTSDSADNIGYFSTTDAEITHIYKNVLQTATFTYKDITDDVILGDIDRVTGIQGTVIKYSTKSRINAYIAQGYILVSDPFEVGTVYDNDDSVDQNFVIELKRDEGTNVSEDPEDSNTRTIYSENRTPEQTVETAKEIVVESKSDAPEEEDAVSGTNHVVNTGDSSYIMLYMVILIFAAIGLSAWAIVNKRNKKHR